MKRTSASRVATLLCCTTLGLAALTGCGPKDATAHVAPAGSSPAAGSAGPATSPPTTTLDEQANHSTVTVKVGSTIRIVLHSTYWSAVTSSAPHLLAPTAAPSVSAASPCPPGGGCGTLTQTFLARAAGPVELTAQRTSCGEAKPCLPDQRTLAITVDITP
ncbi:hypothetical protein [Kitasatospora paranensis]|uniref:Proteinase inhibitor I42 chagasin domain-containing protein n=1 Tax=Kitasatospora paranensis TaxID=258053 RepID=A0ABW2FSI0_9ACTN